MNKFWNNVLAGAGLFCIGIGLYYIWMPLAWIWAGCWIFTIALFDAIDRKEKEKVDATTPSPS